MFPGIVAEVVRELECGNPTCSEKHHRFLLGCTGDGDNVDLVAMAVLPVDAPADIDPITVLISTKDVMELITYVMAADRDLRELVGMAVRMQEYIPL